MRSLAMSFVLLVVGCGGGDDGGDAEDTSDADGGGDAGTAIDAPLDNAPERHCVTETNRYRAMRSKPAVAHSAHKGPGGGHYDNMMGNYGTLGCGIYQDGSGSVTIVQDFGR